MGTKNRTSKRPLTPEQALAARTLRLLCKESSLKNSRVVYNDLLDCAIELLRAEPSIIEANAPNAVIVGDLHGDVDTLRRITARWSPKRYLYILMGDYVDRSMTGTELLALVLGYKMVYKNSFITLRGDHESPIGQVSHSPFHEELFQKLLSKEIVRKVYDQLFTEMPMAVVLNENYFIVHGGIPVNCPSIEKLKAIGKSADPLSVKEVREMLWNDPCTANGAKPNIRGSGINCFGPDLARKFLKKNRLKMIIRGHEHTLGGFSITGKTITLLSTRAYGGDAPFVGVMRDGRLEVYGLITSVPSPMGLSEIMKKKSGMFIRD